MTHSVQFTEVFYFLVAKVSKFKSNDSFSSQGFGSRTQSQPLSIRVFHYTSYPCTCWLKGSKTVKNISAEAGCPLLSPNQSKSPIFSICKVQRTTKCNSILRLKALGKSMHNLIIDYNSYFIDLDVKRNPIASMACQYIGFFLYRERFLPKIKGGQCILVQSRILENTNEGIFRRTFRTTFFKNFRNGSKWS